MRGKILSLVVAGICLSFVAATEAREFEASLETSFMSKYLWHGFEQFGSKAGTSVDLNIEHSETGIYFGAKYMTPNGSGGYNPSHFEDYDIEPGSLTNKAKYIYYAGYKFALPDMGVFNTNLDLKYQYHDYYKTSSFVLDQQEMSLLAEWPDLIGGGFLPYYQATYLSDGDGGWSQYTGRSTPTIPPTPTLYGDDQNANINGWLHKVGLAYDMEAYMPELGITNIRFLVDSVYNDGAIETSEVTNRQLYKLGAGSEWTHITYGAETSMDIGFGDIGLGVYYQQTFADDYANLDDTLYSTISYKMEF